MARPFFGPNQAPTADGELDRLAGFLGVGNQADATSALKSGLKNASPQDLKTLNDAIDKQESFHMGLSSHKDHSLLTPDLANLDISFGAPASKAVPAALKTMPVDLQKQVLAAIGAAAQTQGVKGSRGLSAQFAEIGKFQIPTNTVSPDGHTASGAVTTPDGKPAGTTAAAPKKEAAATGGEEKKDEPVVEDKHGSPLSSPANFGANSDEKLPETLAKALQGAKNPIGKSYADYDDVKNEKDPSARAVRTLHHYLHDNGYEDGDPKGKRELENETKNGVMGPETRIGVQKFLRDQTSYRGPIDGSNLDTQARAFMFAKVNADPQIFEKPAPTPAAQSLISGDAIARAITGATPKNGRFAAIKAGQAAQEVVIAPVAGYSPNALLHSPDASPPVVPNASATNGAALGDLKGQQAAATVPEQQKPDTTQTTVVAQNKISPASRANNIFFGH